MKSKTTLQLVRASVIAALYVALTMSFFTISFGPIQVRIAEALTILPLFFIEAVPGLAIGCFLSNLIGSGGNIFDIVLGPLTTLVAAFLTAKSRKIYFGVIPPIVLNALVVPLILILGGVPDAYWLLALQILAGQAVAVCGLGIPLYFAVKALAPRLFARKDRKPPVSETEQVVAEEKKDSGGG